MSKTPTTTPPASGPPPAGAASTPPGTASPPAHDPSAPPTPVPPQPPNREANAALVVDNGTLLHQPAPAAAATTRSGLRLDLSQIGYHEAPVAEADLAAQARRTAAGKQLTRCFARWQSLTKHLSWRALRRLADNEPLDPNDPHIWNGRDSHVSAVLRRHGLARVSVRLLTNRALDAVIEHQARADKDAGLDWSVLYASPARLDSQLQAAHADPPIDPTDPSVWAYSKEQREALAIRLAARARTGG